jgi:hypothetical protein
MVDAGVGLMQMAHAHAAYMHIQYRHYTTLYVWFDAGGTRPWCAIHAMPVCTLLLCSLTILGWTLQRMAGQLGL